MATLIFISTIVAIILAFKLQLQMQLVQKLLLSLFKASMRFRQSSYHCFIRIISAAYIRIFTEASVAPSIRLPVGDFTLSKLVAKLPLKLS